MKDTRLTFKRYEKKYILSPWDYEALWERLAPRMQPDEFFSSTVCSVYYDTDNFSLIRNSIDSPIYKEKLRLRSYNIPGPDDTVFIELKEKFKGLVYKRRITMRELEAEEYLAGRISHPDDRQVTREIDWFLKTNKVRPRVFIASEREAWVAKEENELRITFDRDIRWRDRELSLRLGSHGENILTDGTVLMEIKMPESAPMWLARTLSELSIFPQGFSKYGTCYKNNLINGVIF